MKDTIRKDTEYVHEVTAALSDLKDALEAAQNAGLIILLEGFGNSFSPLQFGAFKVHASRKYQ